MIEVSRIASGHWMSLKFKFSFLKPCSHRQGFIDFNGLYVRDFLFLIVNASYILLMYACSMCTGAMLSFLINKTSQLPNKNKWKH